MLCKVMCSPEPGPASDIRGITLPNNLLLVHFEARKLISSRVVYHKLGVFSLFLCHVVCLKKGAGELFSRQNRTPSPKCILLAEGRALFVGRVSLFVVIVCV